MARRILEGVVTSNACDKTVTVLVTRRVMHPKYKKYVNVTKKYHAHDEKNEVSGKSGLRLSFSSADFRGYGSFSENSKIWEEAELGAGFFLFKKTLPLAIKIGHNSYSKSISKMKNPSPSSVINPLSKSFSFQLNFAVTDDFFPHFYDFYFSLLILVLQKLLKIFLKRLIIFL